MYNEKRYIYSILCLGCITISFNVAALTAVIPLMSHDLKVSDLVVSRIIPLYMVPYGLGALLYAPLTRYFSYRRILTVSMSAYALASLYCGLMDQLNYLVLGRVLMGISGASAIPLGLIIIGRLFDRTVRGRRVGLFFGCSFFASVAGIMVSGILHWRWLFIIPAILGSGLVLSLLLIKSRILDIIHKININYIISLNNSRIRNIFIFISIISALFHAIHKWFGVYLVRIYSLDKTQTSYIFLLMAVGGFIGQMLGGYVSDKKGRIATCYLGLLGLALFTMMLYFRLSIISIALILISISMAWTFGHNGISTTLTDFSDQERPAIASLNSSIRFISGGIGFQISRYFVENSFQLLFLWVGILFLLLIFSIKPLLIKPDT